MASLSCLVKNTLFPPTLCALPYCFSKERKNELLLATRAGYLSVAVRREKRIVSAVPRLICELISGFHSGLGQKMHYSVATVVIDGA